MHLCLPTLCGSRSVNVSTLFRSTEEQLPSHSQHAGKGALLRKKKKRKKKNPYKPGTHRQRHFFLRPNFLQAIDRDIQRRDSKITKKGKKTIRISLHSQSPGQVFDIEGSCNQYCCHVSPIYPSQK